MLLAGMLDACAVVGSWASTRPPQRLTARHPSAPSAKAPVKITAIVGVVRAELISSASPGLVFPVLSANTTQPARQYDAFRVEALRGSPLDQLRRATTLERDYVARPTVNAQIRRQLQQGSLCPVDAAGTDQLDGDSRLVHATAGSESGP